MSFYRHRNSHRHDFNKKDAKFIINGLFTIGSAFVFKVAILFTVICVVITSFLFLLFGGVGYNTSFSDINVINRYKYEHYGADDYYLVISVKGVQNYEVSGVEYTKVVDYTKDLKVNVDNYYDNEIPEYFYNTVQSGKLRYVRINPAITFEFSDVPGYVLIGITIFLYVFALLLYIAEVVKEDLSATTEAIETDYDDKIVDSERVEKLVEEKMIGTYVYNDIKNDGE